MLIAVTGKKGSGKDTFAAGLDGFVHVKLAETLKLMLGVLLQDAGCPYEDIQRMTDGDLKEQPSDLLDGATPRRAMQTLGTDWARMLNPEHNLWTRIFRDKVQRLLDAEQDVICTDLRFDHEAEIIKELGGVIVQITRPDQEEGEDSHASEQGVSDHYVDHIVINDSTVGSLQLIGPMIVLHESTYDAAVRQFEEVFEQLLAEVFSE